MELARSKEEIERLMNYIQDELDELPDVNFFGESNEETKRQSREWIEQLKQVLAGKNDKHPSPEVYNWVYDKGWSELNDYDGLY